MASCLPEWALVDLALYGIFPLEVGAKIGDSILHWELVLDVTYMIPILDLMSPKSTV